MVRVVADRIRRCLRCRQDYVKGCRSTVALVGGDGWFCSSEDLKSSCALGKVDDTRIQGRHFVGMSSR